MKKLVILAAIVLSYAATIVPRASAQSAMFTYTGVPAGPVSPGTSFTIGINLVFTSGGAINNVFGVSYWMAQQSPLSGFPFTLTGQTITGLFPQGGVVFPQDLDPISGGFGGLALNPQPSGTYPIVNLTFMVAANAVPGSYVLGNTTSTTPQVGIFISSIIDSNGDQFPIATSNFNINVVPEPSSIALLCIGLMSVGALASRRRETPNHAMERTADRCTLQFLR